jgi:large subunit ribosomal protein L14e
MSFAKFVEVGRVAFVSFGKDESKLAVIVDILDQNRVLVDGPESKTGVARQVINLKWVQLTDIVVELTRGAQTADVEAAFDSAKVLEKWNKTTWAKKRIARDRRAQLDDFGRFKAMIYKKRRSRAIKSAVSKARKAEAASA